MKLDINAFNTVVRDPKYEGYDTYLIDDDKQMIDYHIYPKLFINYTTK